MKRQLVTTLMAVMLVTTVLLGATGSAAACNPEHFSDDGDCETPSLSDDTSLFVTFDDATSLAGDSLVSLMSGSVALIG